MRNLWIVTRMELRLYLRGKARWFLAPFMVVSSLFFVLQAYWSHTLPYNFWPNMGILYLFLTFGLVFSTGDQIQRDRDCRLDEIILSTPASTATYVGGKYLASLLLILGLALVNLLVTIAGDALLPTNGGAIIFPVTGGAIIGPGPYVGTWCVLVLVPLLFGGAFTLLITTLTRGQRVVTGMLVFFLWVGPLFIETITGKSSAVVDVFTVSGWLPFSRDAAEAVEPAGHDSTAQVVQLVRTHIPWDHLTSTLWLNRGIFLLLATLCFLGAIVSLYYQRRESYPRLQKSKTKGTS